ncbi:MAG: hypothetical protein IPJ13_21565, partial [Saprospiraceae bacterium]|nr:hypothetical protein [Saprospiraceae bacterium]
SGSIANNGSNQDQLKSFENILQVFPNPVKCFFRPYHPFPSGTTSRW